MSRYRLISALPIWILAATITTGPVKSLATDLQISEADEKKIDAAIPTQAIACPKKPRKLLIFGLNVGYPGHFSIRHANYALTKMGKKTGAFESTVSNDPEMFRPEKLNEFDAVFFNNNVGNLFQDPDLRQSLVDFVYSGGGMLGVHGTTVAFTYWPGAREDWPEFGRMIGGRGANHKDNDEPVVVKLDDPINPLNAPFGGESFDYRDEFFRVHDPYSRNRVRVLLSIDTEKTDLTQGGPPRGRCERADNDYALSWIRNYGRGRVFYCTIAHNPYVFWDPKMLQFYLGAVQFALGDLSVPTTPSAQLTAAVLAQEQLGYRLELSPANQQPATLYDTIDLAAKCKLSYVGTVKTQRVSSDINKPFDDKLNRDQMRQIRLRLDDAGVRLLTYSLDKLPDQEAGVRRLLQFARVMGVELLRVDQLPEKLDKVAQLASEFGIRVSSPSTPAGHGQDESLTPEQRYHIGYDVNLAEWVAEDPSGLDVALHKTNRVFTCVMPPQIVTDEAALPPAEAQRRLAMIMQLLARPELKRVIVRIADSDLAENAEDNVAASAALFNKVSLQLKEHSRPQQ